ncbi:MAG: outer membrane protein assembly factor BamA, partial [Deltaproteobacteria bacterium]|nr:outer membrane protein assembly factor BamA [Deltaproteobacteria bacterium]
MNHSLRRLLVLIPLLLFFPAGLIGASFEMKTKQDMVKDIVSDIPCVELTENAATEVFLEETDGLFRAYDSAGISYRASSQAEAVDGYLRIQDICLVKEVVIKGHSRISPDAIRFRIKTAPGMVVHRKAIKADIEEIFIMGYFEKCDATYDDGLVTFVVQEYPIIVSIEVEGNKKIKQDEILDTIGLKRFDILNTRLLKTSIDRIIAIYREKGFYNVEVSSATPATEGGITLKFTIVENKKLYVKDVDFDGNENISARKIRKVMETKNRWWFGMFSHSGSYLDETLDTDLLRIEQFYGDEGYINAKVGRPQVEIKEDKGIYITIPIKEGPLYSIGEIDITGDMLLTKEELLDKLEIKPGDVMRRGKIQLSIEHLRNIYMDKGYAFVQIRPRNIEKPDNIIDLVFEILKGDPVHIDTIHIRGNDKTRDKVIRRELQLQEGDLFSSTAIQRSRDRLSRLGYFSNVNIEPIPRGKDTMSALVDVEETTTGALSFGLAYSSEDGLLGTLEVSENNLMGKGLKTKLGVEFGADKKSYTFDFEEPWLLDHHISLGFRLFNTEKEYTYYTKKSRGGNIRLSYPLIEEIRHSIVYSYDDVLGLYDIDTTYENYLSEEDIEGGLTSSIINSIYRDTTNDYYRPTRGSDLSVSLEYAGLGGDYHFTRSTAKAAKFFPLYKDKVALMLKFR